MIKNILLSIDFDDNEQKLLDTAKQMGLAFNAKVWLIHIAAPDPDFVGYDVGPQYIRDQRAEDLREEHKKLQNYADNLNVSGVDSDGLLVQGATTDMILKEAKQLNIDLMILGHNKRNYLYDIFVGSVSEDVIKESKIPVLVVPMNVE